LTYLCSKNTSTSHSLPEAQLGASTPNHSPASPQLDIFIHHWSCMLFPAQATPKYRPTPEPKRRNLVISHPQMRQVITNVYMRAGSMSLQSLCLSLPLSLHHPSVTLIKTNRKLSPVSFPFPIPLSSALVGCAVGSDFTLKLYCTYHFLSVRMIDDCGSADG